MKIGVSVPLTAASGDPGAIAHEAENLGFESIWSVEHSCVPSGYTTHYPRSADGKVPAMYAQLAETWVMLAIAAAATKQIKLGTGILLLAQHNVIDTARRSQAGAEAMSADHARRARSEVCAEKGCTLCRRLDAGRTLTGQSNGIHCADQADGARVRSRSRATAVLGGAHDARG